MPLGSFRLNGIGRKLATVAAQPTFQLWAWGSNGFGQLGNGTTTNITTPTQIGSDLWIDVSTGNDQSWGIKSTGELFGWGNNREGATGIGSFDDNVPTTTPTKIGSATNWVSVSGGNRHAGALTADNKLYSWGYNTYGMVGNASFDNIATPVQIGGAEWQFLSSGRHHKLAIKTNGTLWAWGENTNGQLGDGTTNTRSSPVQVGSFTDWIYVSAGRSHSLGIRSNGALYGWGEDANSVTLAGIGQQTSPTQIAASGYAKVSAGNYYSLAITTDGTLRAWGENGSGQVGNASTGNRQSPQTIGSFTNWTQVSANNQNGGNFSQGVRASGQAYGWGSNALFKNGIGTDSESPTTSPTQIGSAITWNKIVAGANQSLALRT